MMGYKASAFGISVLALAAGLAVAAPVPSNFAEYGTTVNGFQDKFDAATLDPSWMEFDGGNDDPNPIFALSGNGTLLMHPAQGDPNKLLYNPGTAYNADHQEVLAMVRVVGGMPVSGGSDPFRGGVTVGVAGTSTGYGICELFRLPGDGGSGDHFNLLDDMAAWGPEFHLAGGADWTQGTWYWMRLKINADNVGSEITAKVWPADGSTPEPADNTAVTWRSGGRTGLAGLVSDSLGGAAELEVGYVLIQAGGLPSIVAPEPATAGLLLLGGLAAVLRRRRPAR